MEGGHRDWGECVPPPLCVSSRNTVGQIGSVLVPCFQSSPFARFSQQQQLSVCVVAGKKCPTTVQVGGALCLPPSSSELLIRALWCLECVGASPVRGTKLSSASTTQRAIRGSCVHGEQIPHSVVASFHHCGVSRKPALCGPSAAVWFLVVFFLRSSSTSLGLCIRDVGRSVKGHGTRLPCPLSAGPCRRTTPHNPAPPFHSTTPHPHPTPPRTPHPTHPTTTTTETLPPTKDLRGGRALAVTGGRHLGRGSGVGRCIHGGGGRGRGERGWRSRGGPHRSPLRV